MNLPPHEKVWQSSESWANGHEETAHSYEPWPVQSRSKMTNRCQKEQVTCRKASREQPFNQENENTQSIKHTNFSMIWTIHGPFTDPCIVQPRLIE